MKRENWRQLARPYSEIRDARRDTVFPFVIGLLESIAPKRLLDYGCGDGQFVRMASRLDFDLAVNLDPADEMLGLAREGALPSKVVCVSSLSEFPSDFFDAVTMHAVWMCLPTEEECVEVLSDISNRLKEHGVFIASVTHPCFRTCEFSTYSTDFDESKYLLDGTQFQVTLRDGEHELLITDTHWNLTAMTRQLRHAGLVVTQLFELPDIGADAHSMGPYPWLIVCCEKSVTKAN